MADVTLTYKGATIAELDDSGSKTIRTAGKFCEGDIGVEYVKPSGGYTVDQLAQQGYPIGAIELSVTTVGESCFQRRNQITSVRAPNATYLANSAFMYCTSMVSLFAPNAVLGSHAAGYCTSLTTAVVKGANYFLAFIFRFDSALAVCDWTGSVGIGNEDFTGCSSLATVILRSPTIVALGNINAFNNTPFSSGGTGGTIYIPKSLYDHLSDGTSLDYKAATNWSTMDGYGTITWAQIEGSIYETQYADGTPIPTE